LNAYEWLKQHGYQGQIYFLTGYGLSHPSVRKAFELGEANVLSKPVAPQNLIELVKDSIGKRDNRAQVSGP
jgi:FixJ family two-component response regulator